MSFIKFDEGLVAAPPKLLTVTPMEVECPLCNAAPGVECDPYGEGCHGWREGLALHLSEPMSAPSLPLGYVHAQAQAAVACPMCGAGMDEACKTGAGTHLGRVQLYEARDSPPGLVCTASARKSVCMRPAHRVVGGAPGEAMCEEHARVHGKVLERPGPEVALWTSDGVEASYPGYARQPFVAGKNITFPVCTGGGYRRIVEARVFESEELLRVVRFNSPLVVATGDSPTFLGGGG